jgi:glycolate oxidase
MPRWIDTLRSIVGIDGLLDDPAELFVYDADGFTVARARPAAVVFPSSTEQVSRVVVSTVRMNRILSIDLANRVACVEAGVRNTALTDAVAKLPGGDRWHFSPDPSSQRASTLGGNAATNAGGIHVLKDFVTSNHVLGVEMVLADGSVLRCGSLDGAHESPFDLPGLICGSEGTLGIITALSLRLSPKPSSFRTIVATFATRRDACNTVSDVIADGHLPAAMEMLDGRMVRLIEETFHLGIRADAAGLILCEIDGIDAMLDTQMEQIVSVFRANHAQDIQTSADEAARAKLWKARKSAFGAIGKISPSYCTQDACVPRSLLADVLDRVDEIGRRYGLTINSIFHAGDGNVHPIFLYDERDEAQVSNVLAAAEEILKYCIDIGGTVTGEHGVGVEKLHLMPYQFDQPTMDAFASVKRAFDPQERINAGKLIPSDKVRFELHKPGRKAPQ